MGQTRVAAYAICVSDGALLLVRLAGSSGAGGMWAMPGGGIDYGESPERAVVRELHEETGLVGEVEALVDVTSFVDEIHSIRIYYRVHITSGVLRDETDGSTDHARWIALARIRELPIVDTVEEVLRHISPASGRP